MSIRSQELRRKRRRRAGHPEREHLKNEDGIFSRNTIQLTLGAIALLFGASLVAGMIHGSLFYRNWFGGVVFSLFAVAILGGVIVALLVIRGRRRNAH
jgi:hypothetical protein